MAPQLPLFQPRPHQAMQIISEHAGDSGATFLAALRNIAQCPRRFLKAFAEAGLLTKDDSGRFVLLHGQDRQFRAVLAFDEYALCIVQEITHPNHRLIKAEDFDALPTHETGS